jgi:uncharacterized protein YukE
VNWSALGRDPVPGDPAEVGRIATAIGAVGDDAADVVGRLRSIDSAAGPAVWRGDAAEAFRRVLAEAGPQLTRFADSHHRAEEAVQKYATALAEAQETARRAESEAERAISDRDLAERTRAEAEGDRSRAAGERRAAQLQLEQADVLNGVAGASGDPVYAAQMADYRRQVGTRRDQWETSEATARGREQAAKELVDAAEGRLATARALSGDAWQDRRDAARQLEKELEDAAPGGWSLLHTLGGVSEKVLEELGGPTTGLNAYTSLLKGLARNGAENGEWLKELGALRREGMTPGEVGNAAKRLDAAGNVLGFAISGVKGGADRWSEERNRTDLSGTERGFRAAGSGVAVGVYKTVVDVAVHTGMEAGGAAIGMAVLGPPGAIAGRVVGNIAGTAVVGAIDYFDDPVEHFVSDVGAGAGSVVYDGVKNVADRVDDAADRAGDVVRGARDTAGAFIKSVPKWKW